MQTVNKAKGSNDFDAAKVAEKRVFFWGMGGWLRGIIMMTSLFVLLVNLLR